VVNNNNVIELYAGPLDKGGVPTGIAYITKDEIISAQHPLWTEDAAKKEGQGVLRRDPVEIPHGEFQKGLFARLKPRGYTGDGGKTVGSYYEITLRLRSNDSPHDCGVVVTPAPSYVPEWIDITKITLPRTQ